MDKRFPRLSRNEAKLIRSLGSRKRRAEEAAFLLEGIRTVEELVAARGEAELVVISSVLESTERGRELLDRLSGTGWRIAVTSDRELERLSDTESPQGVLAVVHKPARRLSELQPASEAILLILDGVADPGNLGTLVRTAAALGVSWVVALPGTVDPWNPKAVRASAGALFHVPVSQEGWPATSVWLRERDFTILCADPDGTPVRRGDPRRARVALVLGSEPRGLSAEVVATCDQRVAVELAGGVESLNVAIAGAILLDRLRYD